MYLWSFLTYGFLGYLLEKVYALVTRSRHTVRKGYLLLPVCPVYGLAMLAVLALPPDMTDTFWHLALYGGLTATAVEYAVHFCCDRLLGVMFWDYSSTKMDLNRRVCLPFTLIWGPLAAVTVRYIHPLLRPWLNAAPPWLTLAAWLLLTVDSFFTVRLLLQYHDIDLLGWKNLLRRRLTSPFTNRLHGAAPFVLDGASIPW